MGLIEKSMLERWEESKLEAELDKAPTKPQECCCEPRFRVQPCIPPMPVDKAIEEIRLAIEKGDSSLVSMDALKSIEPAIKTLIDAYVNLERASLLSIYLKDEASRIFGEVSK
jgi:hypothetical protein